MKIRGIKIIYITVDDGISKPALEADSYYCAIMFQVLIDKQHTF